MKLRGFTDYSKYFDDAKTAIKKKKKSTDYRGLNTKHNYSSFWMDDSWDPTSKFSGLDPNASASSDMVRLIKLSNYRRAITNFVKIVTKKDMPVLWHGSDSYTNGKSITLSTDIKDSNFDVTVGLALHEASHVILTEFDILQRMADGTCRELNNVSAKYNSIEYAFIRDLVKNLLNWVEDRRIDHYIFSTSPGYKAYYHKLYDHYWNSDDIMKAFLSEDYRDASNYDHYLFHIINMMNPSFHPKALPRLDEIVKIVDLHNIQRLKSTDDSLEVACQIADIVLSEVTVAGTLNMPQPNNSGNSDDGSGNDTNNSAGSGGADVNEDEDVEDTNEENSDDNEDDGVPELTHLSPAEAAKVRKAYNAQREFLNGSVTKKTSTKKMQRELDAVAKQSIDIQQVGDSSVGVRSALLYDYTAPGKLQQVTSYLETKKALRDLIYSNNNAEATKARKELNELEEVEYCKQIFSERVNEYTAQAIREGLDMGGLLGKRLQLHNESRDRVDSRLRSGKIDNRRLAHAGYGIEGIFKQIHVDKYKKANLHISLDASGSMSGTKWDNAVKMTIAIAKAASYTQNINVQISARVTQSVSRGDTPVNVMIYDSRKNKVSALVTALQHTTPNSMTPEGLCFEAMIKKDLLVPSSSELDSYFLNISDGEPGCTSYGGTSALMHTKRQVDHMRNVLNISVLSFFIQHVSKSQSYAQMVLGFNQSHSGSNFRTMYGKDATVVDCDNAIHIAKELNKKFLTKSNK